MSGTTGATGSILLEPVTGGYRTVFVDGKFVIQSNIELGTGNTGIGSAENSHINTITFNRMYTRNGPTGALLPFLDGNETNYSSSSQAALYELRSSDTSGNIIRLELLNKTSMELQCTANLELTYCYKPSVE
jgi:hypothetical protein